ncbi:isopeptide-forming domain-containing fimbrial protein [Bacillus velezensis]|nr:isopeptide-forming domain-containing fimbrial protein [Bacillus velezensis]MDQ8057639.1 isopeptide-forming domain-containing fimbrial protein [Bacillus velezensis]
MNLRKTLMLFAVILLFVSNLSAMPSSVHAAGSLTINNADSYGIASDLTNNKSFIYQYDGNNPGSTPKASVELTYPVNNGLALSKTENVFYAAYGLNLYQITPDGTATVKGKLLGPAGNATISVDGTKYYYAYDEGGKYFLGAFDLTSGKNTSVEITGYTNAGPAASGDIVTDSAGYLWFATQTAGSIVQMDPETGKILRNVPITNADGKALNGGVRGISFLPNGKMLLASGSTVPDLFLLDPDALSTTYIGSGTGPLVYDLASRATPVFNPAPPKLESKKTSSIQEKAEGNTDASHPEVGDTLLYTIQTRNTVENSLASKLSISDTIPEGLEYVSGTLKVDGTAVSDTQDDDKGYYADGKVAGQFGDVTDTEWHTVTFEVKVKPGQAGNTIKNTASVTGDNIDKPDEPNNEVVIYPKKPTLESKKTSSIQEKAEGNKDANHPEVGDTLLYTIQTRNTIDDSQVKNLVISDAIPKGLEYVSGTLKVDGTAVSDAQDDDKGHYADGKVAGQFGNVTDTEWHTVTFEVKVKPGQAGNTIKNTASVTGDNIDKPDEPNNEVIVYPRKPDLESKKTSSIQEKAEGNKDADHPEVGDTLLYTIQTRNTIEDSQIKNLVISDVIPEGLEYVSGTLKVDGTAVTDSEDDDKGYYADGKLAGQFGDVTDMEWHNITFEVKVQPGQAGKDIVNTANVGGDNVDTPDKPSHEIKVYPRVPVLESEKTAKNLDVDKEKYEVGDTVVYTIKTRNKISESTIENLVISDELPSGLSYVEGSLKASNNGEVKFEEGKITANFGDVSDTDWRTVTFHAKIESGFAGKTIKNVATVDGDNVDPDKPGTDIKVDPKDPKIESKKTSSLQEKAEGNKDADHPEVGDTLLYTIQTRNTVDDSFVKNLTISDVIPEGLEYVPGTLKVDGKAVSDAKDDDQGHSADGKITGEFGDVTDTKWHNVTFEVKVKADQAGKDIVNIANVSGDNLDKPDRPSHEVKIYPRNPVLESVKTAKNLDKDKQKYEVGDTVVYTIKTRNTVSDGKVKNLVVSDKLPAGLEYVEGSLKASNDGEVKFEDGKIIASFGDVSDTEWRTVTFHAKIESDFAGKTIKNVATVDGDNIEKPDKPKVNITVEQKDPVSDKPGVPGKPSKPNNSNNTSNPEKPNQTEPTNGSDLGNELPNTATNTYNLILVGLVLLVAGTALWYFRRKRNA